MNTHEKTKDLLFTCPLCSADVAADSALAGRKAPCPHCGEVLVLPIHSTRANKSIWRPDEVVQAIRAAVEPYHQNLAERETRFKALLADLTAERGISHELTGETLRLQREIWELECRLHPEDSPHDQALRQAMKLKIEHAEKKIQELAAQLESAQNQREQDARDLMDLNQVQQQELEATSRQLAQSTTRQAELEQALTAAQKIIPADPEREDHYRGRIAELQHDLRKARAELQAHKAAHPDDDTTQPAPVDQLRQLEIHNRTLKRKIATLESTIKTMGENLRAAIAGKPS